MIDVSNLSNRQLLDIVLRSCASASLGYDYNIDLWHSAERELEGRSNKGVILSELQIAELYEFTIKYNDGELSTEPQYQLRREGNDVMVSDMQYPEDGEFELTNMHVSGPFMWMVNELEMTLEEKYIRRISAELTEELDKCIKDEKEKASSVDVREEGEICLLWAICQDPTS